MKKIYLSLPLLLLVGCGNVSNLNPFKQPSIEQQKLDAQNAWDELEGKTITTNTPITKVINTNSISQSNSIPDWFYNPPKSDIYFYGAGEGNSIQQAKANALNYIASEIQTSISSSFSINQGYSLNGNVFKNVSQNIHTQVKNIEFTNIEIIQTTKVDNSIYMLVRVNKQKLFNNLKTKFEMLDKEIDTQIQTSKNYSLLDQLLTINKVTPKIQQAISLASILYTLNPKFDIQKYTNKYTNYLNEKNKILHKLTFGVTSNDIFAQKLIQVLNQKGYKISNNSDIKIKLNKSIRITKPYGIVVVKATINIQMLAKNKILKSTSIEVKGVATNKEEALSKAAINFQQKLQNIDIIE